MCDMNRNQQQGIPRGFDVKNPNPLDTAELMLGKGMARKAAKELRGRKNNIDLMIDQATK